jgi:hypothetical protein
MNRVALAIVALVFFGTLILPAQSQSSDKGADNSTASMPSADEINELLSKADEYIVSYRATFKNAKATLDRSPAPGFDTKSEELCSQATQISAAIRQNGPSAYALVGLIGVLDDMTLNAARASAVSMVVGLQRGTPEQKHQAAQDMQDLAQAEKNCYDISELILHPTMRLIAIEEKLLHSISENQK